MESDRGPSRLLPLNCPVPAGSPVETYHIFNRGTAVFSDVNVCAVEYRFFGDFAGRCAIKRVEGKSGGRERRFSPSENTSVSERIA